jgi:hypothetical protein
MAQKYHTDLFYIGEHFSASINNQYFDSEARIKRAVRKSKEGNLQRVMQ